MVKQKPLCLKCEITFSIGIHFFPAKTAEIDVEVVTALLEYMVMNDGY